MSTLDTALLALMAARQGTPGTALAPAHVEDAAMRAALEAIAADVTPINVNAALKSGDYAYAQYGAPSLSAAGRMFSNAFAPVGERITLHLKAFLTGTASFPDDAYYYLECDPSGGTAFAPLLGSKTMLNSSPHWPLDRAMANIHDVRGGNLRICIVLPTFVGTGLAGYNVYVRT